MIQTNCNNINIQKTNHIYEHTIPKGNIRILETIQFSIQIKYSKFIRTFLLYSCCYYIAIIIVLLSHWSNKTMSIVNHQFRSVSFIQLKPFISYKIISICCRLEMISIHIYVRYFIFKAYRCRVLTLPISHVIFHPILKKDIFNPKSNNTHRVIFPKVKSNSSENETSIKFYNYCMQYLMEKSLHVPKYVYNHLLKN